MRELPGWCEMCGGFVATFYVKVVRPDETIEEKVCDRCLALVRLGAAADTARVEVHSTPIGGN